VHRWLILTCALILVGCGSTAKPQPAAKPQPRPHQSQAERMEAVVRAWSSYLNSGNNAAEARLFALPATMIQGPYGYRLRTPKQVAQWHASLPCSGRIVSISVRGRFATAVFRLGNRKQSKCNAPVGTLAAARFTIIGGKITVWQQVPPPSQGPAA
jgi:hypothetical protein